MAVVWSISVLVWPISREERGLTMDYQETKKMDGFVSRLVDATDLMEKVFPEHPTPWKKSQLKLWGLLDDLATDMMNTPGWSEKYMDEKESKTF
jgi:hypothetical protein